MNLADLIARGVALPVAGSPGEFRVDLAGCASVRFDLDGLTLAMAAVPVERTDWAGSDGKRYWLPRFLCMAGSAVGHVVPLLLGGFFTPFLDREDVAVSPGQLLLMREYLAAAAEREQEEEKEPDMSASRGQREEAKRHKAVMALVARAAAYQPDWGNPVGLDSRRWIGSSDHATRSPGTREGPTAIGGYLPNAVIERVVRNNENRFRSCYERGLVRNPVLQGRVIAEVTIAGNGDVASVRDGGSDIADSAVTQCVLSSFIGLKFPAPENGAARVTYPIVFSPLAHQ